MATVSSVLIVEDNDALREIVASFLKDQGFKDIVVLDKHRANLEVLRKVQPDIKVVYADLAESGDWVNHFKDADVVVMLQAQIGGNEYDEFVRNNVTSTRHVLDAIKLTFIPIPRKIRRISFFKVVFTVPYCGQH